MSSRNMCSLPRATLHSDSEQILHIQISLIHQRSVSRDCLLYFWSQRQVRKFSNCFVKYLCVVSVIDNWVYSSLENRFAKFCEYSVASTGTIMHKRTLRFITTQLLEIQVIQNFPACRILLSCTVYSSPGSRLQIRRTSRIFEKKI